jgi:hypothetical protein
LRLGVGGTRLPATQAPGKGLPDRGVISSQALSYTRLVLSEDVTIFPYELAAPIR